MDGVKRSGERDFVGMPTGLDGARGIAAARVRRGLRAGSQDAVAFADGQGVAVHFHFVDHFPGGGDDVALHLLEFVRVENGGGVDLRRESIVQVCDQRARELAI
jgi:hypothetical protein